MIKPEADPHKAGFYQRMILDQPPEGAVSAGDLQRTLPMIHLLHMMRSMDPTASWADGRFVHEEEILRTLVSANPDESLDASVLKILRVIVREGRVGIPTDILRENWPQLPGTDITWPQNPFPGSGPTSGSDLLGICSQSLRAALATSKFPDLAVAVGRIDVGGVPIGTGVLIGKNRILTNYHVAHQMVPGTRSFIDFSDRPGETEGLKFEVLAEVVPSQGVRTMQRDEELDLAAFKVDEKSFDGSTELPTPASISTVKVGDKDDSFIGVIGFPERPDKGLLSQSQYTAAINAFAGGFRIKTFSPGQIIAGRGESEDPTRLTFLHDTSTLPGSSGSVVIRLDQPHEIVGLHLGGVWFERNRAQCLPSAREVAPELFG